MGRLRPSNTNQFGTVGVTQVGEIGPFGRTPGGSSIEVPPLATPALCHASAIAASFIWKPIVPPLCGAVALPSLGLPTMKRLPLWA